MGHGSLKVVAPAPGPVAGPAQPLSGV